MRRVLLIGWDAADWKIIHALIEQGQMPHTAALIERGAMGDLATLHPVLSPMLWTSIATGKRPYQHGILGFTEPTPDGGGVAPVSQRSRTTKAVWNILNQEGLRCNVIGWWPSHPVEPIAGVMVSNHFQTAVGPPQEPWPLPPGTVHPRRLEAVLAPLRLNPNELVAEQVLPFVPKALEIDQDQDRRLAGLMKTLAECASVHAAATWVMEHEPWDFMAVYYDAIDHVCHGFMRYHPPRLPHIPESDFERYQGVVAAGYRFHDLMLGATLALAPPETTVIICSDHGFHPDHLRPVQLPREPAGPAVEHRDLGVFVMAGPGIRRDHLIHGAGLLDITPTILTLFGLPVGADMDGKPLVDAFESPPPLACIPSWDARPGNDGRLAPETHYDPVAAKEAMDQLVALGYVEPLPANRERAVAETVRELRYNLARSYMDGGRYAEGAAILSELYEAAPDQYRFGVQLALCHRATNRVADLRALVERMSRDRQAAASAARARLPEVEAGIKARQAQAGALAADGQIDHAHLTDVERREYDDLRLSARFSDFDLEFLMGWVLAAEGRPAEALEHLRRAARSDAQRPGLHVQIGEVLLALRRLPDAEAAFRRALAIDPLEPYAHLGLARVCLRQRRLDEGLSAALESVSRCYQNPLAHYVLAQGLMRRRQFLLAAQAMRVAVSINPNFERAHRFLARYYLRFELDAQRAREHWRLAREIGARRRDGSLPPADPVSTAGLDALAPEREPDRDRERRQLPLDEAAADAPDLLADKTAVPADPADCVTVVAGLPRSGTSMMMQMLAAGGLPVLTDGERAADADNPRGYFELEAATRLRRDQTWVGGARGQAVKIVAQLLPCLPRDLPYRVVFMERDLQEVLRSQRVMLDHLGRAPVMSTAAPLEGAFRHQLRQVRLWLGRQPNVRTLFVAHREALGDPGAVAARVNAFLGGRLNERAMAAAVDGSLYRQRADLAA